MENLVALALVTIVLVMLPGPNVALIVANSLKHGVRFGLLTVAGTTAGIGLQLVLVVIGLAALLDIAAGVFSWVRWLGVAYLLYLGIRTWMEPVDENGAMPAQGQPSMRCFWHGVAVAVVNPKLLMFNAAFLPQFVATGGNYAVQLALVAGVYVTVMALGDSVWAVFAGMLRPAIGRFNRLRNRLSGGIFILAGIGLAAARDR